MKSRVLMAALVVTLLMGVRGFASPCDPACDPCGACDGCVRTCDLFSGLKKLVNGVRLNNCGPCDGVVACNPCDEAVVCNPCDDVCGDGCGPRGHLLDLPRVNLKRLFDGIRISRCDTGCGPCDEVKPCDSTCIR